MSVRVFEDSAGAVWEVFEVQRRSEKVQAVSAGLERGWLTFACGPTKRRLAPFPKEWLTADAVELERLCSLARAARAPGSLHESTGRDVSDGAAAPRRTSVPRIRPSRAMQAVAAADELPIVASATSAEPVERTVREFAHQARSRRLPAIEAMVQLKGLLARVYTEPTSPARDLRAVRRWFVESYYFEQDVTPPAATDQSL